ncbi:hypothetical protein Tco_0758685 [Tanacetum coccineum]
MAFRNFMTDKIYGEFNFLLKDPVDDTGAGSPSISIITETLTTFVEPLNITDPSQFAKNMVDSEDSSSKENDTQKPPTGSSKTTGKPSQPLDIYDSNSDMHDFPKAKESKESKDCHWVVSHVTHLSWKAYLKEMSLEKLYDYQIRLI